ncbi:hypothetical protein KKC94_05305 [Patescibacteria group bacterium]|nr:hypothetical protein [Patescibacteria group bacterium]
MINWLFNFSVYPISWSDVFHFLGLFADFHRWADLFLVNAAVFLLILVPGVGISYLLQPNTLPRAYRLSFGLALGFLVPVVLFYVLGVSHLYYRAAWAICGVLLSGLTVWCFGKQFLKEWGSEKNVYGPWIFYGLIGLYFLGSYFAFYKIGSLDFDIMYSQVGPASYLFLHHSYNPFGMGVLPSLRHELFPGPISFHSVFTLFGTAPWVAVTAAMVFLAPIMVRMLGQFSELLMKRSEYLTAFLALVTFTGFRLRSGRGTVLALVFLFAFLLLPKIYEDVLKKHSAKLKELWQPILAGSIFVALAMYTNVEIAAILIGIMGLWALGAWLDGEKVLRNVILSSFAGGLLIYFPWFLTVGLLVFKDSLALMLVAYFALASFSLLLVRLPGVKISGKKLQWGALSLFAVLVGVIALKGEFESVFRLPGYLYGFSAICAAVLVVLAFRKPDFQKHLPILSVFLFGVIFIAIYPYLKPIFAGIGLPESLNYFLFDKELGSVFPELRAKIHEYFLPLYGVVLISVTFVLLKRYWLWDKWFFSSLLVVCLFFGAVRIHKSDMVEYARGQTLGANLDMILVVAPMMGETPEWYSQTEMDAMAALAAEVEPGDTVFNFFTAFNPYGTEYDQHYIEYGIATLPLAGKDLVSKEYTPELLDQVISAGADFVVIFVNEFPSDKWVSDPRTETIFVADDYSIIILEVN